MNKKTLTSNLGPATTRAMPVYQPPQSICAVQIYTHGTLTDRGVRTKTAGVRPGSTRKRSAIETLSRASAARLRRLLAQTKGPGGWACFGATLTVPGPPVSVREWHRIWNAYRHKLLRLGNITLIWRIELQERGQPHVHCVCWGKNGSGRLREYWLDALDILGPYEGPAEMEHESTITRTDGKRTDTGEFKPGFAKVTTRSIWPGAFEHSVKTDGLGPGDKTGWWRYLAAHASKSKQAQLGWKGRQWGVVNKGLLDREEPVLIELTHRAMNKVIRCLRKITKCRFASGHGRQTWFVRPESVARICGWAKGEAYG